MSNASEIDIQGKGVMNKRVAVGFLFPQGMYNTILLYFCCCSFVLFYPLTYLYFCLFFTRFEFSEAKVLF